MQTLPSARVFVLPRKQGAPAAVDHVTRWRELSQQGEAAATAGNAVRARQLHGEALAHAEALFEAAQKGDEEAIRRAPPLYCISCNNIVTLANRQGDDATASFFLYRAFARLLGVAESRAALVFRARCALFLDSAARAFVEHLERVGESELANDHFARANTAVERVRRLQQLIVA